MGNILLINTVITPVAKTWAQSGDMIGGILSTGRFYAAGTISSALSTGGYDDTSEEFNGSSWSAGGDTLIGVQSGNLCGVQTSALRAAGYAYGTGITNTCESYNGTSWASETAYPITATSVSCVGALTAALSIGGTTNTSYACVTNCYTYNGSSWTATGSLITARKDTGAVGTTSDALTWGGFTIGGSRLSSTEEFNGSSWSAGGSFFEARSLQKGCGVNSSAGVSIAGSNSTTTWNKDMYEYDGTSWSDTSKPLPINFAGGSCGNLSDGILAAGQFESFVLRSYLYS